MYCGRLRSAWLFLCLIFLASPLFSQTSYPLTEGITPDLEATRVNPATPVIDGNYDDPMWNKEVLKFATEFYQMDPDEGMPASESTKVAVVYDDEAVYFAFWNYDNEPENIKRQLVRRDRWTEADRISIGLDPYHDHQSGFRFEVNASGVQRDMSLFNDTDADTEWDGVWESAVNIYDWGWFAEIKIPYHCLRFPALEEHTWGVNFTRYISRKTESDWWAFSPSTEGGMVSRFGHITGIHGIRPKTSLEILPYAVSSVETEPVSAGNPDGREIGSDVGVDLKYSVTSNLTLNATINPDFGQVELDRPVLNLTSFETWFPERRPFFVEGADLFSTQFALFYSRRIGGPVSGLEATDDVDYYTEYPRATSILGAAKLTGKIAKRTSIAFLNATTAEEKATYFSTSGLERDGIAEPLANYSVLRIRQELFNSSFVGGLFTLVSQDNRYPVGTGGVDWRLSTDNATYDFSGQMVYSRLHGEKTGFGMTGRLSKNAGKYFRGSIGWTIKDPNLYINRLGFTARNDARSLNAWLQYRTTNDWWFIRNSWHNLNSYQTWNYAGNNIERGGNYNFWVETNSGWEFGGGVDISTTTYSDRETRDNGLWELPQNPTYGFWFNMYSDRRKPLSWSINPGAGKTRQGTWWANYIGVTMKPRSNIELEIGANYHRSFNQTRWVSNISEGDAVFASLAKDEFTPRIAALVMVNRNLSIQLSANTVIAGLDYHNPRAYQGGLNYSTDRIDEINAQRLADDSNAATIDDNTYDYNFTVINSTMIVRWEFLPGSTLYLVWTRARPDFNATQNNLSLGRDFEKFFSSGADNVFLVKASYWWHI